MNLTPPVVHGPQTSSSDQAASTPSPSPRGDSARGDSAHSDPARSATASALPASARHPLAARDLQPRRRMLPFVLAGAGVVLAAGAAALVIRGIHPDPPRLNEEPAKIAKYSADSDFEKLPFERQAVYMKLMSNKEQAVRDAYKNGKLSDDEYRKALEAAHLGKQISHMKKYLELPLGSERDLYLDRILDKKKDGKKSKKSADAGNDDLTRDNSSEALLIKSWPPEVRAQWNEFQKALRARKKTRKAAATNPSGPS